MVVHVGYSCDHGQCKAALKSVSRNLHDNPCPTTFHQFLFRSGSKASQGRSQPQLVNSIGVVMPTLHAKCKAAAYQSKPRSYALLNFPGPDAFTCIAQLQPPSGSVVAPCGEAVTLVSHTGVADVASMLLAFWSSSIELSQQWHNKVFAVAARKSTFHTVIHEVITSNFSEIRAS